MDIYLELDVLAPSAGCEREPIRIMTDGMSSLESKDDGRADEGVTGDESSELQDQDYLWWEWKNKNVQKIQQGTSDCVGFIFNIFA